MLAETGMTLPELWRNPAAQEKASPAGLEIVHEKEPAEMLRVWPDNYVERGSFDDRTLLAIEAPEK